MEYVSSRLGRATVNHKTVTRQSLLRQELRFLDLEWDK